MSEYQYYEFLAVDRPLDTKALAAVRALSTRARITPTSFVNTYQWGDFKGDPRALVERYYDAFLYTPLHRELGHPAGHAPAARHPARPRHRRAVLHHRRRQLLVQR